MNAAPRCSCGLVRTLMISAVLFAAGAAVIIGCEEKKGPIEKPGEKVDKAVEKSGDAVKKAGERTGDALEEAADKVKDAGK